MKTKIIGKPSQIPVSEMKMIIGGRKAGMTGTKIKSIVDDARRMAGTFKGQGISTNTISRILSPSKDKDKGKTFQKTITKAWSKYEAYKEIRDKVKDKKKYTQFDKAYTKFMKKPIGNQGVLEPVYLAQTDEIDWQTP